MFIYLSLFTLLSLFSFVRSDWKFSRPLCCFFALCFIIIAGLRGEGIGFDYDNYAYHLFERQEDLEIMEPGFVFLVKLIGLLGNVKIFFLTFAILSVTIKIVTISKYSYFPILGILIYYSISFIIMDLGQIRYGLAIGISLIALILLAKGYVKGFFVYVFVAICFHYSAICIIPVYFFYNRVLSLSQIFIVLGIGLLAFLISSQAVVMWLLEIFPIPGVSYRIGFYMSYADNNSLGPNLSLLLRIAILYFIYKTKIKERDSFIENMFNFYLYGIFIYMLFSIHFEFAIRCSGYFRFLEVLLIPNIIKQKPPKTRALLGILTIAYCFYSISKILLDEDSSIYYVPYRFAETIFQ